MNDGDSLLGMTLAEAAAAVADRTVSPVELTEACLRRIEQIRGLCAYIDVWAEQALAVARASETLVSAGHRLGELHGVPIAIKDNVSVRGYAATAGSKILQGRISHEDATVARRLRSAGAIFVGTTNMHEFAWGGTTDNPHYGAARNPWDPTRFPGGSSGGSGVAVATRSCFGALGTDTGGSVRIPAAINGVVGLRPTYGRVSNAGVVPLAWSMDTVGPLTRTAEDCALMFEAISGGDTRDPACSHRPVDDVRSGMQRGAKGIRVGVIAGFSFEHNQPAVGDAVASSVKTLVESGAELVEVEAAHLEHNCSAQLTIESAEPSTYHQRWMRERPGDYGEDVRGLLEAGELLSATHYLQAQRYRTLLRDELFALLDRVDVLITPTVPFTATPLREGRVEIEDRHPEDMLSAVMQFTGLPSLTGFPAISIPCGFDGLGLPIGMQVIARPFNERLLLRVAAAYQAITDFHREEPTVWRSKGV